MPLKNVFADAASTSMQQRQQLLYQRFGLVSNPFPSAAQTSGHPHMPTVADDQVDHAVKTFYNDRKSQAIAITASQGIGKTNLLNAYEKDLQEFMEPRGFFVIRYMADPEPSFDPLIRSIFACLHENNLLRQAIEAYTPGQTDALSSVKTPEVRAVLRALLEAKDHSEEQFKKRLQLAEQWLLGLPVRKEHQTELHVQFRLDTVESKTRALRDIVSFSTALGKLAGIFLLLDELEKQTALSKTRILQYLTALRALIDALPSHLFLMVALTVDALERYREMLPALRGRLMSQVPLKPLQTEDEAIKLMHFYLENGREEAKTMAGQDWGSPGTEAVVKEADGRQIFNSLFQSGLRTFQGIRQREFLNELHNKAEIVIDQLI